MKPFTKVLKRIQKYDIIGVFRHVSPDYDALGSQFGLVTFLKDNFPDKKIYALGKDHSSFTGKLYPSCDIVDDEIFKNNKFLAIVLDTANSERVDDERYDWADYIIKIDHHPASGIYANFQIVDESKCATAEMLTEMLFSKEFKNTVVSQTTAKYLYSGIVGDSGRFQYSSVSSTTFELAAKLIATGFNFVKEVYTPMYTRQLNDLKVTGYLLNNFKVTDKGVGYYHISAEDMKKLGITFEKCKEHVNLLANIEEIKIWVSFYEDIENRLWRVSIRSRDYKVNDVASQFNGGGHDQAAGANAYSYEETYKIVEALDNIIN
ncbi:TPA: bifunctional oligoribonuclease/PAP phosphatase NrnA [bacterium]|jgi:phosphoesterase RecJ-like protein|nr:bifunctional oligoribonuclease/PAP phosphatase NrnA [bacterium]